MALRLHRKSTTRPGLRCHAGVGFLRGAERVDAAQTSGANKCSQREIVACGGASISPVFGLARARRTKKEDNLMQFRRVTTVAASLVLAPLFIACSEASDPENEVSDAAASSADAATSDVVDAATDATSRADGGAATQTDAATDVPTVENDAATDAETSIDSVAPGVDAAVSETTGDGGATHEPDAAAATSDVGDAGPVKVLDAAVTDAG